MKVYSIGREHGCDIEIDDNSYVISRRHATLRVKWYVCKWNKDKLKCGSARHSQR